MDLRSRTNLVHHRAEAWRPQAHSSSTTGLSGAAVALRGVFDLQLGSIRRDVRSFLGGVRGRLLDVGCGAQPFRALVPEGVSYVGIDTREALDHFGYQIPDTIYFEGPTWPVEDESCDAILCTEVLEHVLDPKRFLREAHRCLAPGGRLCLTVPFAARWHYIPHDYWRYTPSCLDHLLTTAGFRSVEVYGRGDALTVACYKVMALMLPFLFPQGVGPVASLARRAVGILLLPAFLLTAIVANLSLSWPGGAEDCLGYTVLTERGPSPFENGRLAAPRSEGAP
jgi:SAM-dependent methyltransferase